MGVHGLVNGDLQEVYTKGDFPKLLPVPAPRPCGEPLLTHGSTGHPPTRAGSFISVSHGVFAPFL